MIRLGIDFGTTRTGVAVEDRGNYPLISFTTPAGDTLDHYPTVVAEKGGELRYGLAALECVRAPGWTVLRSFKRLLSNPGVNMGTSVVIGRSVVQLVDLVAGFLAALREDLWASSNLPRPKKKKKDKKKKGARDDDAAPVFEAIVATPANAHSTQRLVTLEAFRRAGFEVVGMMNEPAAAGVEFANRHGRTLAGKREKVAVYDLGGGTFDASLVDMEGLRHEVIASAGLAHLGGDDFDEALFELALEEAELDPRQLSVSSRDRLVDHCRRLKEALHPNNTKILVELGANMDQVDRTIAGLDEEATVTVSAADYYDRCGPLVDRTIEVLDQVLTRGGAEPDLEDVAAVYVVGGASSLPIVGRRLRDHYKKRIRRTQYASGATAIGLATAFGEAFEVQEKLHRSFGVFREAKDGAEVAFDRIFNGNTLLPGATGHHVEVRSYRPMHNVGHYRFVECGWLDDAGTPAGDITPYEDVLFPFEAALQADPKAAERAPVRRATTPFSVVEERYELDDNGVIVVTIRDTETGFEKRAELSAR